jgi:acetyltransferase-like isoleucine patch superfamily enzyme
LETPETGVKVLAVADSDSYLKWAAQTLSAMPPTWRRSIHVLRTSVTPSPEQIADAVHGTPLEGSAPPVTGVAQLLAAVRRSRPDVLLLSGTGPFVEALASVLVHVTAPRPLIVTGLPGVSVPATRKALQHRRGADLFVVHSTREVAEFSLLAQELGLPTRIALNTLPFLRKRPAATTTPGTADTVLFATQAKVPQRRNDRLRILGSLIQLAESRPDLRVVVKLRARMTEQQTHFERFHYESLYNDLVLEGKAPPGLLHFEAGAMAAHLETAAALVTVSSTAALEAIAADVPVLILGDFGVNASMINLVFKDSGMIGTLGDLRAAAFPRPTQEWKRGNYFHSPEENDWLTVIGELLTQRSGGVGNLAGLGSPVVLRSLARLSGPSPVARGLRAAGRRAGLSSSAKKQTTKSAKWRVEISGSGHEISIADSADLGDSTINVSGEGCRVVIGEHVSGTIDASVSDGGTLVIGQATTIEQAHIVSQGAAVEIGEDCVLSQGVDIRNTDAHAILDLGSGERINPDETVRIGRHVWMGKQAMVLKGTTIGDGAIVAPRALVAEDLPPNSQCAGVPARVLRRDIAWVRAHGQDTFGLDFRDEAAEAAETAEAVEAAEAVLAGANGHEPRG